MSPCATGADEVAEPSYPLSRNRDIRADMEQKNSEIPAIAGTLKRLVRAKGLTYARLAETLNISEASVKRYLNGHRLTMEILERLCGAMSLRLSEFYEIAARETVPRSTRLTLEQEEALCREPRVMLTLVLLLQGWSPDVIQADLGLTYPMFTQMLLRLEALDIIQLHPGNRVRMLVGPTITLEPRGPVRRKFDRSTKEHFMAMDYYAPDSFWDVQLVKLSRASVSKMDGMIQSFGNDIRQLAESDRKSGATESKWCLILSAGHPIDLKHYLTEISGDGDDPFPGKGPQR